MNSNPKISIITVCLNSAKTIRATIESVLHQTYSNYEYIIKDGGSMDETVTIAESYTAAFNGKLRVVRQSDAGIYDAMNQGITLCTGDLIGIINSDDYYSPDTLENVAKAYSSAATPLWIVIGDMERVTDNGETIYRYHFTQEMVDKKYCFGHPSMFAAKAVYDRIGLYDTTYRLAADGDWQYRALEDEAIQVVLCPEVFNHMREGGASDNPKYRWVWFRERSRMQLEHKRGSKFRIYRKEFFKVIKLELKGILPKSLQKRAYRMRYAKK